MKWQALRMALLLCMESFILSANHSKLPATDNSRIDTRLPASERLWVLLLHHQHCSVDVLARGEV